MSAAYELTALARLDLLQIWNYLADEESIALADRMLADIEKAMLELVEMPGKGHRRQDLTRRPLLFYLVHSYQIVYRADLTPLRVVRVLHAAQNVKVLLRK